MAGIESDQPLTLETTGGQTLTGQAQPAASGQVRLAGSPALELKQVEAINPEDLDPLKISGQVNLGVDISRGNTNKQTIDAMGRAVMTWKTINRAVAGFEVHQAQSSGNDTSDNSKGYIDYNRFVSEKWYWLANLRGEQDRFKNIDFRGMTGLGMGYQVWRSKKTNLLFELGPDFVWLEEAGGNTEDYFAWRWHIGYDRWLFNQSVQFYHRQTGFVAMDNMDNWIWSANQGAQLPPGHGLRVHHLLQHRLRQPARARQEQDRQPLHPQPGLSVLGQANPKNRRPGASLPAAAFFWGPGPGPTCASGPRPADRRRPCPCPRGGRRHST